MEDNSSSDDETRESPLSPKMGGKKLKLNDGSSQDSCNEAATASNQKDENVDSGVCADKSESTSSDDRAGTSRGPSNEVVNIAPSASNIRAIIMDVRRPRRVRNYRKRKTPDRDSDSNDSSNDSDDLSLSESQGSPPVENSSTDGESEIQRFMFEGSDGSPSGGNSSSNSSHSYDSDMMIRMGGSESEDERVWTRSNDNGVDSKAKKPEVLMKTRPQHNYVILREIINREMGLTFPCGTAAKNDIIFEQKFYGSLHSVYRMKKLHHLDKHKGCVNTVNFHPEGRLLASGSDDTIVIVWDWARNVPLQMIRSGHKSNVFQSKFLYLNARSQLNIVTCARDGQVRLLQCPPSGGSTASRRRLASHARAAHKLHVCPHEPHTVVSAGEDGLVMHCDVRQEHATKLIQVKEGLSVIPLYSVQGHPLDTKQLVVSGRDEYVRVYDRRKCAKPVALYSPSTFHDNPVSGAKRKFRSRMHLTCAVYNHDGSEILGSYNDEDIYLFDSRKDVYDKSTSSEKLGYTHRYSGHRNSATFKGVAFFGPRSEYVVSGSDCSYVYIWHKRSQAIVQWLMGDVNGVINCIETHPRCPVLATSGLDKDVKIWVPRSHKDPTFEGLERVVRQNTSKPHSPLFNDFLPTLYSAWRGDQRMFSDDDAAPYGGNIEFDGNMCTTI